MDTPAVRKPARVLVLRRVLRQVHLWLGLTMGGLLALIGASGAALIFAEPMVRREAPQLFTETQGAWRPVSEWIAIAERKYPDLAPLKFVFGPGTIPMPMGTPIIFKIAEKGGEERHALDGIPATSLTRAMRSISDVRRSTRTRA